MKLKVINSNKKDGNMSPKFKDKEDVIHNKKDFFIRII